MEEYNAYFNSNSMNQFAIKEQQSYLKVLLDDNLKTRLSCKITDSTEIYGENGCIELLKQDFDRRYPIMTRRMDYFQRKQHDGESFTDYLAKLKELGKLADLEKLKMEDLTVYTSMCGTNNKELLDDMLKLEDPTIEKIEQVANIFEGKSNTKKKLYCDVTASVTKTEDGRPSYPRTNRPFQRSNPTNGQRTTNSKCKRCNETDHQHYQCSWKPNVECHGCGRRGHIKPACPKGDQKRRSDRPTKPVRAVEEKSTSSSSISSSTD
ncbi:hypothetical protein COA94_08935 [Paramuricea clavata]|uniref:Uncharacterized protein n=1 Tax=Paramuricea clavata TaxID=317549 RepID=A0A7D9KR33_PARCT|nr:hypothetical protein COA94_08935 [Paramuricea clavata]